MKKKKIKIPDFGMHTVVKDFKDGYPPVTLQCRYMVPGLTMHDLMQIFVKGKENPKNSEVAADPSRWPEVRGLIDVIDAVLQAVYGDINKK